MARNSPDLSLHQIVGGALSLDFANSVDTRGTPREQDFVPDLESFTAWCRLVGLFVDPARPPDATIEEVHGLRDAVLAVVSAAAKGEPPDEEALGLLNRYLPPPRLTWTPTGFALDPGAPAGSLRNALAAIARDAVDLLTGERKTQLRTCDRHGRCDWLFLDNTRNHSRRYCTENCAVNARVERHKRKAAAGSE